MHKLFEIDKNALLENIHNLHTTELGIERIRRNLQLQNENVVEYCKQKIEKENSQIYKQGKNWYCEVDGIKITVNSYSYTIITAYKIKYCYRDSIVLYIDYHPVPGPMIRNIIFKEIAV